MSQLVTAAKVHYLPAENVHYKWDVDNDPTLVIDSGDTVILWTRDVSDNQVGPDSDASALANLDWDRTYPLTGPIAISGAEPGDTLKVEILDVHTQGWGWTGVIPGSGLLRTISRTRTCGCSTSRTATPRTSARTSPSRWSRISGRWAAARPAPTRRASFRRARSAETWTSASSCAAPPSTFRSKSTSAVLVR